VIHLAIVDDEKTFQNQLCSFLDKYSKEHGYSFSNTFFNDGSEILDNYALQWDLIFMDIKMDFLNGMATAREIRALDKKVILIFITTMAQFAIKGYEVDALDFILKPLNYELFSRKMDKYLQKVQQNTKQKFLILPNNEIKERVSTDLIFYIEIKNHNLFFVKAKGFYVMRYSLSKIEKELEAYDFFRCSNSYVINLKNVTGIKGDHVLLGEYKIPISRSRKKEFLERISNYVAGHTS